MSPAVAVIFSIKPPPTLNNDHKYKFNSFLSKNWFSSRFFCTLKQSAVVSRKSVRFKKTIAAVSTETGFVSGDHGHEHIRRPTISGFEQEALINNGGVSVSHDQTSQTTGGLHTVLNHLSKWVVAITFGGYIMLRHDDLALWAALGSVSNFILSITLKRILKQERPASEVSSGPGMPSSHAQTAFFTLVFVFMSVIERMGLNGATTILGILLLVFGSYLSWLRVLLGYHTISQVIVGVIVGSNFALLWFWAWEAVACKACNSNPWVQMLLYVGGACYYLGFISYVLWYLRKKYRILNSN